MNTPKDLNKTAFIFIYDNMTVVHTVDAFLKSEESKSGSAPKMALAQHRPKAVEYLRKAKYDFVMIDQACITGMTPMEWIQLLRKEIHGGFTKVEELKMFLITSNAVANNDLENYLIAGFDDVFIKPLDMPIVSQKINNITGADFSKENQLYFAQINTPVKIAYRYELDGLSEAGCRVVINEKLDNGEVFTVIIPEFERFGIREIVAKVLTSREHDKKPGYYLTNVNFVGIQPSISKSIRKWMVEDYIKNK
jgi:CheY-like chemotaxis protein